jgi:hypothetical protein
MTCTLYNDERDKSIHEYRTERNCMLSFYSDFTNTMSCKSFFDEQKKLINKKFIFQRWLYGIVGILTMIPIILLTIGQIRDMERDNNEFAVCLLLLVHSGLFLIY